MWKQPRFLEPTGNLIQPHLPLSFSYFPWIPNHLGCFREPYVIYKELLSDCLGGLSVLLFFHASCSFFSLCIAMWKEKTDHRGGAWREKKRTFSGQLVKETSTSKVFKLSHKSLASRQIEQNGPFQKPQLQCTSTLGTKGGFCYRKAEWWHYPFHSYNVQRPISHLPPPAMSSLEVLKGEWWRLPLHWEGKPKSRDHADLRQKLLHPSRTPLALPWWTSVTDRTGRGMGGAEGAKRGPEECIHQGTNHI